MDMLETMLFERYHPKDIMKYIGDNYKSLTKDYNADFNDSLMNPENEKVQRYNNTLNIPTMRFLNKDSFVLNGILEFYPQYLFNDNNTSIFIDNKPYYGLNTKKKNIRLYRITACSIIVEGDIYYESELYENKKILFTPSHFDYRFMNMFDKSEVPVTFKSKDAVVTIFQHVEYIPMKKCANCKLSKQQIKVHQDILKNKLFEITEYDPSKFISKVEKEYS